MAHRPLCLPLLSGENLSLYEHHHGSLACPPGYIGWGNNSNNCYGNRAGHGYPQPPTSGAYHGHTDSACAFSAPEPVFGHGFYPEQQRQVAAQWPPAPF